MAPLALIIDQINNPPASSDKLGPIDCIRGCVCIDLSFGCSVLLLSFTRSSDDPGNEGQTEQAMVDW